MLTTGGGMWCRSTSSRGRSWKWNSRTEDSVRNRGRDPGTNMANPLIQTIEALAKEKGIEPDVVITAIEEAVATASRKYYKTGENLRTRFNLDTGQVDLFALKTVVQEVTNAATEISIEEARD